ncbi:TRAP transporter large permease subunit [Chelatococcus sp. GCM10030263]|uniref:TRAP transporter large permease n=1 Tax=Chelatococcus sp. GCM10030263 TaxID=3273387 RepID=UPI0036094F6A
MNTTLTREEGPDFALEEAAFGPTVAPIALPRWLEMLDGLVLALLNIALAFEVVLVFANTLARTMFGTPILLGIEETSQLLLIVVAFLGGAIAYRRGDFMSIKIVVDNMPEKVKNFLTAASEWITIVNALVIGVFSIPLIQMNAGAKTTMLGLDMIWLTVPMTLGAALFVIFALIALWRVPRSASISAAVVVAALLAAILLSKDAAWIDTSWYYIYLLALFVGLLVIGVPIGFVLASVGLGAIVVTDAAPMAAVAMNAQRGAGGFIFLALPFFILAGFIMDRAGIGAKIVDFLASLMGHLRGGMLQVMIVGMYISSGISGSKAADMATIGIPMNRLLNKRGYSKPECAALLAASAAMGEAIPPSIAVLVLGSVTSVSTGALFLAGFLPAATLAASLMLLVYVRARISGWERSERAPLSIVRSSGKAAILPLLMPVVLVGGIVGGVGTPTEVSTFAVVYGIVLGILYRKIKLRDMWSVLSESSILSGMIFFTLAGSTVFSWALSLEGVPQAIADAVGDLGPSLFLPTVIVLTILMGALLESLVTIVILGPLLLPVALHFGIDPLQYGIVMVEAFGIGGILPPIGIALYVSCTICRTQVEKAMRPLTWYLVVMCVALLLVASVPWITTALPTAFNMKG